MARDFNEGIDLLINVGLDGLPTANKLWAWLCGSAEADVTPTTVRAGLVLVGTAVAKTAMTSASRIIDLGAIDFSASNVGTAKSVVVSSNDPSVGGAKLILIQDLNGGAAVTLSPGGVIVDDLAIEFAYLVSGSVA